MIYDYVNIIVYFNGCKKHFGSKHFHPNQTGMNMDKLQQD